MKDGLVSIVIPVFNHQEALGKTLTSIAQQQYTNIEVIIIDDGSDVPIVDADCEVLAAVQHRIIRQKNMGAPAARNRGLEEAMGEFVIFWDADVSAQPLFIKKLVNALRAHPEVSYAYTDHRVGLKAMPARAFDPAALKQRNYIHSTALLRTKDAIRWDESLTRFQDWDLWLSLHAKQKKGMYVQGIDFVVTPRRNGMSTWLPRFAYYAPFSWLPSVRSRVMAYKQARKSIRQKHHLM